jgi:hypothetical protein
MSRLLLHPLREGGNLTRVPPGRWATLPNPDLIADIALTEAADPTRRARISSVPSPWARLQVFRDAVLDEGHPFHAEAINDILDTLELVLFQDHLVGVSLRAKRIDLADVRSRAQATRQRGVERFAAAVVDLAPATDRAGGARLATLTVVFNGPAPDAPILFATSPFTLFFTPQTRRARLPGYYTGPGPLRPLATRPPDLARYVRDVLVPELGRSEAGRAPELQRLTTLLDRQLRATPDPGPRLAGRGDPALTFDAEVEVSLPAAK